MGEKSSSRRNIRRRVRQKVTFRESLGHYGNHINRECGIKPRQSLK